uniref:Retrotransposon gag domain-containing protein n=1 Tax=Tanacetum cinerariifolium TaxID=118510 RepID=A0A6L2LKF1_TANCI|nr:hypothetical protein [Tanacetum cinerariifolium]
MANVLSMRKQKRKCLDAIMKSTTKREAEERLDEVEQVVCNASATMAGRIRALEQETRELNVKNKQKKNIKARYDVTTPQELRRNQVNEEISHHYSYGITASSQLRRSIMVEGDIDNLTIEQYLELTRGKQAPRVTHDAVMLRVFPITLTRAAKRWVDRLSSGTVDSWNLLKKAFIQMYCLPSKTAKQLKEIRNFKQEGDETLYQAWERHNDFLYKFPTHDINNHQKTMADHSQKWHDGSSSRNSNYEGITTIVPQEEKQNVSYYVEPYELPILFGPSHTEEALVHETIESLKKIRINRPLLKEIRHIDNYAKYMKDLVANKPKSKEDDKVRMNTRCSALLQNQLPPKEHDPGSFILSCFIRSDDQDSMDPPVETDVSKECEDPEECKEDKANALS